MNAPQRNPLDGAKYREQYLSNLRLQASNDQRNQNANQIFKNTGQTPSRPLDMRTATEKAGDFEGAKVDLRSRLGQITDGIIASQIIGELGAEQIRFAIDNWGTIEPDMRRQFSSGVPTSAFIAYLNRLIQKFQLTDGVETGLQQATGNEIIMSNTQILYGLPRKQIWNVLRGILDRVRRQFDINVAGALDAVEENERIAIDDQQTAYINQLPPELKSEVFKLLNQIFNNVASNKTIGDLIGELQIGLANRDKKYTERAVKQSMEVLTLDDSVIEQKQEIQRLITRFLKTGSQDDTNAIEGGPQSPQIDILEEESFIPSVKKEEGIYPAEIGSVQRPTEKGNLFEEAVNKAPRLYTEQGWSGLGKKNKFSKVVYLIQRLQKNPTMVLHDTKGKEFGMTVKGRKQGRMPTTEMTNDDLDHLFEDYMSQSGNGNEGAGLFKMRGKGLNSPPPLKKEKIVKPYRQSITHLIDKPVEKPKPYTQFGRYFINKERLNGQGIMAFRTPHGNTISTLPTEKISKNLSKIMTILVGKGIPSYEEIGSLTKEEKMKLREICNHCRIDSPAIPKMKGEGEQEEDRFQILRGEIIAGNDNEKIAKEFKGMLIKFMNSGRIPRRQANEILQELLLLGH